MHRLMVPVLRVTPSQSRRNSWGGRRDSLILHVKEQRIGTSKSLALPSHQNNADEFSESVDQATACT